MPNSVSGPSAVFACVAYPGPTEVSGLCRVQKAVTHVVSDYPGVVIKGGWGDGFDNRTENCRRQNAKWMEVLGGSQSLTFPSNIAINGIKTRPNVLSLGNGFKVAVTAFWEGSRPYFYRYKLFSMRLQFEELLSHMQNNAKAIFFTYDANLDRAARELEGLDTGLPTLGFLGFDEKHCDQLEHVSGSNIVLAGSGIGCEWVRVVSLYQNNWKNAWLATRAFNPTPVADSAPSKQSNSDKWLPWSRKNVLARMDSASAEKLDKREKAAVGMLYEKQLYPAKIALKLNITVKTVFQYENSALKKLEVMPIPYPFRRKKRKAGGPKGTSFELGVLPPKLSQHYKNISVWRLKRPSMKPFFRVSA